MEQQPSHAGLRARLGSSACPRLQLSAPALTLDAPGGPLRPCPGSPAPSRWPQGSPSASPRSPRSSGNSSNSSPVVRACEPVICRVCDLCERVRKAEMSVVEVDAKLLAICKETEDLIVDGGLEDAKMCGEEIEGLAASQLKDLLCTLMTGKMQALQEIASLKAEMDRVQVPDEPSAFNKGSMNGLMSPKVSAHIRNRSGSKNTPKPVLSLEDFQTVKPLTSGAFGAVYLVRKVQTGDLYAMKVISKTHFDNKNQLRRLRIERDILAKVENDFVVRMYWSFSDSENVYLVMEYLQGGDCFSMLQTLGGLEESSVRAYLAETVAALQYLHGIGIVHRDLKPDNLLIDKDGHIKLTDFGLSKIEAVDRTSGAKLKRRSNPPCLSVLDIPRTNGSTPGSTAVGTPDYMAPEILLGKSHGPEVDWWSLGCIAYEFVFNKPPFNDDTPAAIFENIISHKLTWPSEVSQELKSLIEGLLESDPQKRLGHNGAEEVKSHPFFAATNWASLRGTVPPFSPCLKHDLDTSFFEARQETYPPPQERIGSTGEDTSNEFFWVNFGHLASKTRELFPDTGSEQTSDDVASP
eukprot:m51a1_g11604 putative serine threonine protein kinase 15 (579) ;mRNA; f:151071-153725